MSSELPDRHWRFAGLSDLDLIAAYNEQLGSAVRNHNSIEYIATTHLTSLVTARNLGDTEGARQALEQTAKSVQDHMAETSRNVRTIVEDAAQQAERSLPKGTADKLSKVREAVSEHGLKGFNEHDGQSLPPLGRIALDAAILKTVNNYNNQRLIQTLPALSTPQTNGAVNNYNNQRLIQTLPALSTPQTNGAVNAMFDERRNSALHQIVGEHGPKHPLVEHGIESMSSDAIRSIALAGLNWSILSYAGRLVAYGEDPNPALRHVTPQLIHDVVAAILHKQ